MQISVKAAAVNPTDVLSRERELYANGTPGIPGMDAAGVVESVGEGVERLNGRVFAYGSRQSRQRPKTVFD